MKSRNKAWRPVGRRPFLKGLGVAAFLLGLPAWAWAYFLSRFPVRTVEEGDFDFDPQNGRVKQRGQKPQPYALRVEGLVEEPLTFSYEDLRDLAYKEQTSDFHCVEGWSVADLTWGGFVFGELLNKVKPLPQARYAVFHSLGRTGSQPQGQDHYLESFPLSELLDPQRQILLALDLNGKPLTLDHGAPLRVVAPLDLAYKSIKFVTRIELAAEPRPGWWTLANPAYPIQARVPARRLRRK